MKKISLVILILSMYNCANESKKIEETPIKSENEIYHTNKDKKVITLKEISLKIDYPKDWILNLINDSTFVIKQDTTNCQGFCENLNFMAFNDNLKVNEIVDSFINEMTQNISTFQLKNRAVINFDNNSQGELVDYVVNVKGVSLGGTYMSIQYADKKIMISAMGPNDEGSYNNSRVKFVEIIESITISENNFGSK